MVEQKITLTFARGARRVTGSNFLLTLEDSGKTTRILVDCGLVQGDAPDTANTSAFSYDASTVDAVFFTHAHADHIGLYPKLYKAGFRGVGYATPPTADLMPIMLEDTASLMARLDAPPYTISDIEPAMHLIKPLGYDTSVEVGPAKVRFLNAGHIVGSALIVIEVFGKKIVFTGDLGRVPAVLVNDWATDALHGADVLITESVYGNRTHGSLETSTVDLKKAVQDVVSQKGVLLIPAFSLERTQIILEILNKMIENGEVPHVPVYMDSPLASKVTDVYRRYPEYLRTDLRARLESNDDPFLFKSLTVTVNKDASHAIDSEPQPKIIIAGAGMSHGGRIRHHESRYLDKKSTILMLVGYQVPGSLGRRLKDGQKAVDIDGRRIKVNASIRVVDGYSAHADRDNLLTFAEGVHPKRAFVVLGETEAATFLAQRLSGFLGIPADIPREGEEYVL